MKCCDLDTRSYFLCWTRLFFGIWILYAGLNKFIFVGPNNFVGYITTEFAKTWSPFFLNTILAWVILVGEVVLGLLLIFGVKQRTVWTLTALLMFMLTFGQTMLQKDVSSTWMYTILCLVCAAWSDDKMRACGTKPDLNKPVM